MSSAGTLVLDEIVDDIIKVVSTVDEEYQATGTASYGTVQKEIGSALHLHLLNYLRFLEGEGVLTYDRITDEIRISQTGREVLESPEKMYGPIQKHFEEQLGPDRSQESGAMNGNLDVENAFSNMFDDVAAEVDDSFSSSFSAEEDEHEEYSSFGAFQGSVEEEPKAGPVPSVQSGFNRDQEPEWSSSSVIASHQSTNTAPVTGGSMQSNYERIEELGSGGIGTVFRGRQVSLNREVAIKEVREIFSVFAGVQRQDILQRFQSIVQTQASLLHPNIIQVVEVDISGEYPFSVMQLAPNGNLRRLIDHGSRPPLVVALKYFLQILHALNTAHDQGVVHGSLKPENVVLDSAGNALVTDFGISKIVERDGGRGNQVYVGVGTVAYMSPEQFQDPNLATIKSDIYSLGIMFYEMLTGKVPGRRSPMPSSFYPDIPRALDDIFDKMSMDREEDRYGSVQEIIEEIYAAEEVLSILDKRSGVLFLRDPMVHGETGLTTAVVSLAESVSDSVAVIGESEQFANEVQELQTSETDHGMEEEFGEDFDSEADSEVDEEEIDFEAVSEVETNESGAGGVLDKLDKYGQLFEED